MSTLNLPFTLRPYQASSIEAFENATAAVVDTAIERLLIEMGTGLGKAKLQVAIVHRTLAKNPAARVLVVVDNPKLVDQLHADLVAVFGDKVGLNSEGLGERNWSSQIIVASIQSVFRNSSLLGHRDLILVDECHRIPASSNSMYQQLFSAAEQINPHVIKCGLTATPYRTGAGRIDEGPNKLFDRTIFTYGLGVGCDDGWLVPPTCKAAKNAVKTSGLKTKGGDFADADLSEAFDRNDVTESALDEILPAAEHCQSVMVFGASIAHVKHVTEAMQNRGVSCVAVHSDRSDEENKAAIEAFKRGEIKYILNVMMLTTGFDCPAVDAIVMLTSTLSPGKVVQIAGRGTRPVWPVGFNPDQATAEERKAAIASSSKPSCLFLDFGGNIKRHGPLDLIGMLQPAEDGKPIKVKESDVRAKSCPNCWTMNPLTARVCENPECGYEWPPAEQRENTPHNRHADRKSKAMLPKHQREAVLAAQGTSWRIVEAVSYSIDEPSRFRQGSTRLTVKYRAYDRNRLKTYITYINFEEAQGSFMRRKAREWWQQVGGQGDCPWSCQDAMARILAGQIGKVVAVRLKQDRNDPKKFWPDEVRCAANDNHAEAAE